MKVNLPILLKGDKILIVSPAKYIHPEYVSAAEKYWQNLGYEIEIGSNALNQNYRYSGTVKERLADLQWALNHPTAKAIICARGGYGTTHLLDEVDWIPFLKNPKWVIGYSDITLLHNELERLNTPSLHGTVPLDFPSDPSNDLSLNSLQQALSTNQLNYKMPSHAFNQPGIVKANITGGNLAMLSTSMGTHFQPNFEGKILFIEEIGEYDYAIDRMLYQLKHANVFNEISGLIVGHFTHIKDSPEGMGLTLKELILQHVSDRNIPVIFDFPAGHDQPNLCLPLHTPVEIIVDPQQSSVSWKYGSTQ